MNAYITKGSRVAVDYFATDPFNTASLAGCVMKTTATRVAFSGTVAHVRGDHPVTPTKVVVFVTPDKGYDGPTVVPPGCSCGVPHVAVNPDHIVGGA